MDRGELERGFEQDGCVLTEDDFTFEEFVGNINSGIAVQYANPLTPVLEYFGIFEEIPEAQP